MNVTSDLLLPYQSPLRYSLSVLPCLFCLYINIVMLVSMSRKPVFKESARYILFAHLLFTDSFQLVFVMLAYSFFSTGVKITSPSCLFIIMISNVMTKLSPLNIAVMSLERYVAICFPLRHAEIATNRKTKVMVAVIWTAASMDSLAHLFVFVSDENVSFSELYICARNFIFRQKIYATFNITFTIMCFVSASVIIIYTYIAIVLTARSASHNTSKASKAHRTVLLHLLQFGFCVVSILYGPIVYGSLVKINFVTANTIKYVLFLSLMIFPRCLSPLIYGLRDQQLKESFANVFTFGLKKHSIKPCNVI